MKKKPIPPSLILYFTSLFFFLPLSLSFLLPFDEAYEVIPCCSGALIMGCWIFATVRDLSNQIFGVPQQILQPPDCTSRSHGTKNRFLVRPSVRPSVIRTIKWNTFHNLSFLLFSIILNTYINPFLPSFLIMIICSGVKRKDRS